MIDLQYFQTTWLHHINLMTNSHDNISTFNTQMWMTNLWNSDVNLTASIYSFQIQNLKKSKSRWLLWARLRKKIATHKFSPRIILHESGRRTNNAFKTFHIVRFWLSLAHIFFGVPMIFDRDICQNRSDPIEPIMKSFSSFCRTTLNLLRKRKIYFFSTGS